MSIDKKMFLNLPNIVWRLYLPIAAIMLIAIPILTPARAKNDDKPAKVLEVGGAYSKQGKVGEDIVLPAQVLAYQSAILTAKVAGYLKTITVDKGDKVTAGQLLATLEVPELVADHAQYKAQADVARSNYNRIREAAKTAPDLVTPQSVDEAQGRFRVAQAQLERTETLLRYARITAPFSGTITGRFADPGAYIPVATSSAQQNAAVVSLMNFERVRIQAAVPESEAGKISEEIPVVITIKGLAGKQFTSKVTRISYALDQITRTMLAEIEMENPDATLRPGMYATVRFTIPSKNQGVVVPVEALVKEGNNFVVFRVVNRKAVKTAVTLGNKNDKQAEILTGLSAGQLIVVPGKEPLSDGASISLSVKK